MLRETKYACQRESAVTPYSAHTFALAHKRTFHDGIPIRFGPSAKVEIELAQNEKEKRKTITVDGPEGAKLELPIFTQGESIEGKVRVVLPPGKKLDHIGIRLEVIGIIDLFYDRTNSQEFTSRCDELETQGQLDKTKRV